jgi:hypothetical protein
MSGTAEEPARKRAKYAGWTSPDKIWLIDLSKKNPRMSYEDLGEVSAEFDAKVTDAGDKRETVKRSTVASWKREKTQLRNVWDDHKATRGDGMIRNKNQQNPKMGEASYAGSDRWMLGICQAAKEQSKQSPGSLGVVAMI